MSWTPRGDRFDLLELLLRVWELKRSNDHTSIRELLEPVPFTALAREPELAIHLINAYSIHWQTRKAGRLVRRIKPVVNAGSSEHLRLELLNAEASTLLTEGRIAEGKTTCMEYHDVAELTREDRHRLRAAIQLGVIAAVSYAMDESLRWYQRALAIARSVQGGIFLPVCHHNVAHACRHLGLIAEAQRHHEECERLPTPAYVTAHTDLDRGMLMSAAGDLPLAEALVRRALERHRALQNSVGIAEAHCGLASIALCGGDCARARMEVLLARESLAEPNLFLAAQIEEEAAAVEALGGSDVVRRNAQERARRLYKAMGTPRQILRMNVRIAAIGRGEMPDPAFLHERVVTLSGVIAGGRRMSGTRPRAQPAGPQRVAAADQPTPRRVQGRPG